MASDSEAFGSETLRDLIFKQSIGGDQKTFDISDPDKDDCQKLTGPGGEDMGTFQLLGPIPKGQIQVPDDGKLGIVFPVFSVLKQEGRVCRYVGPLARGMAMFCAHKAGLTVVPLTDDLKRMIAVFDRHEGLESGWAFKELALEDVLGRDGLLDVIKIAKQRGLIDKHGRRTRKSLDDDDIQAMPSSFTQNVTGRRKR